MFFEDEKDIIGNNNQDVDLIQSNDFDDILNEGPDDLISIKSASEQSSELNDTDEIPGLSSINLEDELKFVDDAEDDDVDEEELARILSEDETSPRQKAFDAFGTSTNELNQESEQEFDLEQQLKDLNIQQENEDPEPKEELDDDDDDIPFRPNAKAAKKNSLGPVMVAVTLGALVVAGSYFVINNVKDTLLAKNKPVIQNTQQNYEETTQENIQEVQEENIIPVVSEEEISSVKPDEKKSTIDVDSAGRVDPFMPLQKYIATEVEAQDNTIDYSKAGVLEAPAKYGETDEPTKNLLKIAVSGIMYDDVKPSAIISFEDNDYFVQKGDKLDDYRIVDITRSGVKIALGKNIYKANIGEEFKISSFYGNTTYIPTKHGSIRQYQLLTKEGASKDPYKRNYTSEDDIEVIPD